MLIKTLSLFIAVFICACGITVTALWHSVILFAHVVHHYHQTATLGLLELPPHVSFHLNTQVFYFKIML